MRATIKDVAREAGVSVSTVTYALKKKGPVTKESHKRVLAAAEKLGYVPDATARSLVKSRADSVALILPGSLVSAERAPFFIDAVSVFSDILGRSGNWLNLYMLRSGEQEQLLTLLTDVKADGIVWVESKLSKEAKDLLARRGLPSVAIVSSKRFAEEAPSVILNDPVFGIEKAVAHLKKLGHKKVGVISAPPTEEGSTSRSALMRHVLMEAGLENTDNIFVSKEINTYSEVLNAGKGNAFTATAFMATTDYIALQTMKALKELGYRLPEDISVIGFDDVSEASQSEPPLTTIRQPIDKAAEAACRYLFACREEKTIKPLRLTLETELILRGSTASPKE